MLDVKNSLTKECQLLESRFMLLRTLSISENVENPVEFIKMKRNASIIYP